MTVPSRAARAMPWKRSCSGKIFAVHWRRIGISALIAAALVTIVVGFMQVQTGDSTTTPVDPAIEALVPQPGELVLRQSQVGVDLAPGYEGTLDIDSTPIPDDQLTINAPLNQVFYQPGPGKEFSQFAPGRHCVTAHFFKSVDGPDTARAYSWCFNVS
ncbi:MAG TPA: hypothetical protein VMK16_02595 [Acidimicrobiales bacterium]|nr:hypothetical protein [Acidimicrobiales bacterium]